MSDRISVLGIRARGHHGVLAHERRDGQEFVVDVWLELDLSTAGHSDVLADTVDYGVLAEAVVADVERDPLDTIEALAHRIVDTCLADQRVQRAGVTVHKPQAPVTVPVSDVSVTITRSQR